MCRARSASMSTASVASRGRSSAARAVTTRRTASRSAGPATSAPRARRSARGCRPRPGAARATRSAPARRTAVRRGEVRGRRVRRGGRARADRLADPRRLQGRGVHGRRPRGQRGGRRRLRRRQPSAPSTSARSMGRDISSWMASCVPPRAPADAMKASACSVSPKTQRCKCPGGARVLRRVVCTIALRERRERPWARRDRIRLRRPVPPLPLERALQSRHRLRERRVHERELHDPDVQRRDKERPRGRRRLRQAMVPALPRGRGCETGADCLSSVCWSGTCEAPTCTDGVKNGDEAGVDCGGEGWRRGVLRVIAR